MSFENTDIEFDDLRKQLEAIEEQCASSNLVIYQPSEEHEQFFKDLCRLYLDASPKQRARLRSAVSDKPGILNHLLGYVYKSAEQIHSVKDKEWLRIGLAAASLENCGSDYRDSLLALAELYVAAEVASINPRSEFKVVAGLTNFHTYAVLKERQRELRKGS
jgi:hypothetical protein